eukprot:TRINITY_DN16126_c0_g1_i1.p1 TRINITY_DN16126_c0_g1~~TRINITY_DN16126_c0_g1_i1.p1  ORF type:complete len:317 (+),score=20.31 TRINITY_DN16126_c0_g1_i1:81-953(+)
MVDLSESGLAVLRMDNSKAGAAGWERAREGSPVVTREEVLGGVPCLWVDPPEVRGAEVVLYLHGGGFVVGSPEDDMSMTARLACCLGRRVCVPRYRLAPEHPYPAASDDVLAVYCQLLESHPGLFLVGESAGGNLALGLMVRISSPPLGPLRTPLAIALFSPWIDLSHSGDSHTTLRNMDPTLSVQHFLAPAALAYAGQRSVSDPCISPLFAEMPLEFPPTILSTATRDLLMSDSVRLATKLRCVGRKGVVDLRVAEGLWHVFEWYPQCPEALLSIQQISDFLFQFAHTH